MDRRKVIAASFAGALVVSAVALGGYKVTPAFQINSQYGYAQGVPAAVRADSVSYDWIGCQTWVDSGGAHGACYAGSPTTSVACSTTDLAMVTQIRAMQSDSNIYFNYNVTTGICTYVSSYLNSFYPPKTL